MLVLSSLPPSPLEQMQTNPHTHFESRSAAVANPRSPIDISSAGSIVLSIECKRMYTQISHTNAIISMLTFSLQLGFVAFVVVLADFAVADSAL